MQRRLLERSTPYDSRARMHNCCITVPELEGCYGAVPYAYPGTLLIRGVPLSFPSIVTRIKPSETN